MRADPETYPSEVLADEEPRYLRRQRPIEVRRRKFGRKSWPAYRRWLVAGAAIVVVGAMSYEGAKFLLFSPYVSLDSADQIEVTGNQVVSRETVTDKFASDFGKSIVRVPLTARREGLESLPWVAQASVERDLPNRIRVQLTERVPIAYLRSGNELDLLDASGAILDRPLEGKFAFPVVSGMAPSMDAGDRAERMKLYQQFMREIELARAGSADQVSEVDLSNAQDLRASLTGLMAGQESTPILVHFGSDGFVNKYRMLLDNIAAWTANAGRVQSVDLRFNGQVVVNPESGASARAAVAATKP